MFANKLAGLFHKQIVVAYVFRAAGLVKRSFTENGSDSSFKGIFSLESTVERIFRFCSNFPRQKFEQERTKLT